MVKILRKRFDILKRSIVILIVFSMLGINVVIGIIPDNSNGIGTEEMVQQPSHTGYTWFLESMYSSGGFTITRRYDHTLFFYNFTVMSNSTDSIVVDFTGNYLYDPHIGDMTLTPGESLVVTLLLLVNMQVLVKLYFWNLILD